MHLIGALHHDPRPDCLQVPLQAHERQSCVRAPTVKHAAGYAGRKPNYTAQARARIGALSAVLVIHVKRECDLGGGGGSPRG